jgi:hypothetical protein
MQIWGCTFEFIVTTFVQNFVIHWQLNFNFSYRPQLWCEILLCHPTKLNVECTQTLVLQSLTTISIHTNASHCHSIIILSSPRSIVIIDVFFQCSKQYKLWLQQRQKFKSLILAHTNQKTKAITRSKDCDVFSLAL